MKQNTAFYHFASALPARSASAVSLSRASAVASLPRRCLHGVHQPRHSNHCQSATLCLGAACTECILHLRQRQGSTDCTLPRRCLHGVHLKDAMLEALEEILCLGAACTECITAIRADIVGDILCLGAACTECISNHVPSTGGPPAFASALPARSASIADRIGQHRERTLPRRCLHGVHRKDAVIS